MFRQLDFEIVMTGWINSLTFLLVADEDLQGNGSLHLDRHLVVVDETEAGQLQGCLQVLVTLELHLTEVMQYPAGLWGERGVEKLSNDKQKGPHKR